MERVSGWEIRLGDFINSKLHESFNWGTHDCAMFSYNAVKEMTHVDVAHWFRSRYRSKLGAYRLMKEFSGGGLEETVEKLAKEYEMKEIKQGFAGRGDLVLCNVPTVINEELPTLGIIGISNKICMAGTNQLQMFERKIGVRFWAV
jgi:hypothetical protein